MANRILGDQSRNPCFIPVCTALITSPVKRPSEDSSSVGEGVTVTESRKTATPCMGSAQRGPCRVESWKAWVILSENDAGLRDEDVFCSAVLEAVVLSFRLGGVSIDDLERPGKLTIDHICLLL